MVVKGERFTRFTSQYGDLVIKLLVPISRDLSRQIVALLRHDYSQRYVAYYGSDNEVRVTFPLPLTAAKYRKLDEDLAKLLE